MLFKRNENGTGNVTELEALAILAATPLVGYHKISALLNAFGSAAEAIAAPVSAIESLHGFGPAISKGWGWWKNNRRWQRNLELLEKQNIQMISYNSSDYPPLLKMIKNPPVILYVKGKLPTMPAIAVIGSRKASLKSLQMTEELTRELVHSGFAVVSGLAEGADTAAHRGTLSATGITAAVLGSGLANLYPKGNQNLADLIVENGALISERPPEDSCDRQSLLQRNRIITGMSQATVSVEAAEKGGTINAMEMGYNQRRPLFAFPFGAGNSRLIASKKATALNKASDLIESLLADKTGYNEITDSVNPFKVHDDGRNKYERNSGCCLSSKELS